jgi:hypothetical protein
MKKETAMNGYEAGTSGVLALQHLEELRSVPGRPHIPSVGRLRHGVGTGLIRLGARLAGADAAA